MAATDKTWSDNNPPACEASDLNGFKAENNNLIEGSGQLLDTGDNQQTQRAVANYAAVGDFYIDSGAVNAYVLAPGGSRVAPSAYFDGMAVRFRPNSANTGPATIKVGDLDAKPVYLRGVGGLPINCVQLGTAEAVYNGTVFEVEPPSTPIVVIQGTATSTGTGAVGTRVLETFKPSDWGLPIGTRFMFKFNASVSASPAGTQAGAGPGQQGSLSLFVGNVRGRGVRRGRLVQMSDLQGSQGDKDPDQNGNFYKEGFKTYVQEYYNFDPNGASGGIFSTSLLSGNGSTASTLYYAARIDLHTTDDDVYARSSVALEQRMENTFNGIEFTLAKQNADNDPGGPSASCSANWLVEVYLMAQEGAAPWQS